MFTERIYRQQTILEAFCALCRALGDRLIDSNLRPYSVRSSEVTPRLRLIIEPRGYPSSCTRASKLAVLLEYNKTLRRRTVLPQVRQGSRPGDRVQHRL